MFDKKMPEAWRVLRIQAEIVDGIEHLIKIQHAVIIFGSARLLETNPYYAEAEKPVVCYRNQVCRLLQVVGQASWKLPTKVHIKKVVYL